MRWSRFVPAPWKRHIRSLLSAALPASRGRVEDLSVQVAQLATLLSREGHIPPPPPKHLQVRVVGGYRPGFLESGYRLVRQLDAILSSAGHGLEEFGTILDFGCGCGRAERALKGLLPACDLHGTDIDGEAISWLKTNCAPLANFSVCPPVPPTAYGDEMFAFIFGISVFTHLPEEMAGLWLRELERICTPGGLLLLTTHGDLYGANLGACEAEALRERGFTYGPPGFNYGRSIALPDFYQNAYHTHAYIRREWGRVFDVVEIRERGMDWRQDAVLLQKRPAAAGAIPAQVRRSPACPVAEMGEPSRRRAAK